MQQKFGVFADVVDVLCSLFIDVDFVAVVVVVDDKWEEGSNVVATDSCCGNADAEDVLINLLCILTKLYTKTSPDLYFSNLYHRHNLHSFALVLH